MDHLASKRLSPIPCLLVALLAPEGVRANGFALDIQGLFSNGTASAGAASAHDPAGQFANPAILASLEGTQVVAGGQLIAPRAPYTDQGSTFLGGAAPLPGANGDGAQTGFSPWLFASHRISPAVAIGFQVTTPFGTATDYGRGSQFYGRYQGVESRIESLAFGPAVAFRPVERLAVGLGIAARRDSVVIGQAFDLGSICVANQLAGSDPDPVTACTVAGLPPGGADGYGRFKGQAWGWSATAGVTVEPVDGTTLGLGYRHESTSKVRGHQSFDASSAAIFSTTGQPRASMDLPLPDFLTVSASQRLGGSVTLLAAYQYTLWSRFDTIDLVPAQSTNGLALSSKQGFRDAFRLSGAVAWKMLPALEVFGGVAFEQSPITTRYRQVSLPESDSLIAGLGAEARLWGGVELGAVYQRVQMIHRSRIDQTGLTGDHLVGSVKGSANLGIVQIGWRH
ncbi:MAG TPA: outer membrane protein transport protein [Anaeromyxobacter sp.]|nr:outer membrane protein transport protein [Anaeromyxobacter sp.]